MLQVKFLLLPLKSLASYVCYCLRSQGEAIILEILKGYQAFTQVMMFITRGFNPLCQMYFDNVEETSVE